VRVNGTASFFSAALLALGCLAMSGCAPTGNEDAFDPAAPRTVAQEPASPDPGMSGANLARGRMSAAAATTPQYPATPSSANLPTGRATAAAAPQTPVTPSSADLPTGRMTAKADATPQDLVTPTSADLPTALDSSEYRIKPDDILQIVVYQVPDFSRDAQVDVTGAVVLPLLGPIPAAGKTMREFQADLTKRLKAKYLQNPQVSVSVKDAIGMRVTISGQVAKPEVVPIRGNVTLMSLIAESGGFTDLADQTSVLVIRNTESGRTTSRVDASAILSGKATDPPIYGGDTIVVDESAGKNAWKNTIGALGAAGLARALVP
jgi:polysaccharide export outer membrane protein